MYSLSTNGRYVYGNLVKRLRQAGFKVKYSLPKYSHNVEAESNNVYFGLIWANNLNL